MNNFFSNTKCGNRVVRIRISFTRVPVLNPPIQSLIKTRSFVPEIKHAELTIRHIFAAYDCFAVCAKAAHAGEETVTYCKNNHDVTKSIISRIHSSVVRNRWRSQYDKPV